MKRHKAQIHKLTLRKETVRTLKEAELGDAAGGSIVSVLCATRVTCPTERICVTTPANTNI